MIKAELFLLLVIVFGLGYAPRNTTRRINIWWTDSGSGSGSWFPFYVIPGRRYRSWPRSSPHFSAQHSTRAHLNLPKLKLFVSNIVFLFSIGKSNIWCENMHKRSLLLLKQNDKNWKCWRNEDFYKDLFKKNSCTKNQIQHKAQLFVLRLNWNMNDQTTIGGSKPVWGNQLKKILDETPEQRILLFACLN